MALLLLAAAPAAAETAAPPPVPSSYELRRLETQVYQALARQAAEARRKSRQRQYVGDGAATGTTAQSGLDLAVTPELVVRGGVLATLGLAAFSALSEDTSPLLNVGNGGSGRRRGPTAGPPSTTTSTR